MAERLTVAIAFHRLGPYHQARLAAAAKYVNVIAVELSAKTDDYAWEPTYAAPEVHHVRLCDDVDSRALPAAQLRQRVDATLSKLRIDVVAVNGWSENGALAMLQWAQQQKLPAVLMSESNRFDAPRRWLRERIKRRVVSCFSSALVGGTLAKEYANELSMPIDQIFLGYDVIDNTHFERTSKSSSELSREETKGEVPYFLASSRFISKKNLSGLIAAYATYRSECHTAGILPWNLVILGSGMLQASLETQVSSLGLVDSVTFPGFVQYEDLPDYYHGASTFVHASVSEQWGLVVNEAMAAGLPLILSRRCGCTADLLEEGVNGFSFDPYVMDSLAELMSKMTRLSTRERQQMGKSSHEIISHWAPDRFGTGMRDAVESAIAIGPKRSNLSDRLLISALAGR